MKRTTADLGLKLLLLLLIVVSISGSKVPPVLPETGPADQFSAARAREHVAAIAQKPHPMGSAEHARVREYIVGQLASRGLQPELQEAVALHAHLSWGAFGRVINVMARLEGRERGPAVLLVSHYDTVPTSPGAADDSSGVATMLETLRALRAAPQLRNDVLFLFTDGEEMGLLGARAFVDQHPWAADVGVVLNFEARGTRGPVQMFETSPGNGRLIRAFGDVVAAPAASSYSYEIYRRLPNDTDFSVFKHARIPGLNFAFVHGGTSYHTAQDTLENLDLRSLQHDGESALALTRHLGDTDLEGTMQGQNAVYFDVLGRVFVSYASVWVPPITALLTLATVAVLFFGFRSRKLSAGGFALGFLLIASGTAVFGFVVNVIARQVFSRYNFVLWQGWTSTSLTYLGLGLVTTAVAFAVFLAVSRRIRVENLLAGGLLAWLLLSVGVSVPAPGTSYLFALPLAAALASGAFWLKHGGRDLLSRPLVFFLGLCAAVVVLLWVPTLSLLAVALRGGAAPVVGALLFLLPFALLTPHLALVLPTKSAQSWLVPVVLAAFGLTVLVGVRSSSGFDLTNRRPNTMLYYFDAEAMQAQWISLDRAADSWTSQYLSEDPELRRQPAFLGPPQEVLTKTAPRLRVDDAQIEWLGAEDVPEGRAIRFRIRWPFEVDALFLFLRSEAEIRSISSGAQRLEITRNFGPGHQTSRRHLRFYAPAPDGVTFTAVLGSEESLEVDVVAQRYGLPELTGVSASPRPPDLMPAVVWLSDSTFIRNVATRTPGLASVEPRDGPR